MKNLILDIDYTLNTDNPKVTISKINKLGYDLYSKEAWLIFEERAFDMSVNPHPIPYNHYLEFIKHYEKVIIITARPESFRRMSEIWLHNNNFYYNSLFCRPDEDIKLTSMQVKKAIVEKYSLLKDPKHCVAIDDDNEVIEYYKSIGVKSFKAPEEWKDALDFHRELELKSGDKFKKSSKSVFI